MKTLILIATLISAGIAQASYIQTNCTNSDGTIINSFGHSSSELSVTKLLFTDNGVQKVKMELDRVLVDVELSEETLINKKSFNSCDQNLNPLETPVKRQKIGFAYHDSHTVTKMIITNKDGSDFPEGTVGLSDDKKSISDYQLCHRHINNSVPCLPNISK